MQIATYWHQWVRPVVWKNPFITSNKRQTDWRQCWKKLEQVNRIFLFVVKWRILKATVFIYKTLMTVAIYLDSRCVTNESCLIVFWLLFFYFFMMLLADGITVTAVRNRSQSTAPDVEKVADSSFIATSKQIISNKIDPFSPVFFVFCVNPSLYFLPVLLLSLDSFIRYKITYGVRSDCWGKAP